MAEAKTTDYFQSKLKEFGNLTNKWSENEKLTREAKIAFEHAQVDVEFRLDKYRALRMQELDKIVNKTCYKNKEYNYLQAQKWEEYHVNNDYKLGILNNFTKDYIWRYMLDYQNCTRTDEFKSLPTTVEKDHVYLTCHNKFMEQWKGGIQEELSAKAKEIFEGSD